MHRDGIAHEGISLRFGGQHHRIDFKALVGESAWLYPQTDVFIDLANARDRDGGDVRFGVSGTRVLDVTSDRPVPPTGAKGLNLALADVRVLAEVLERAVRSKQDDALEEYSPRVLARVWKAQHFSYWITTMLHTLPGATGGWHRHFRVTSGTRRNSGRSPRGRNGPRACAARRGRP